MGSTAKKSVAVEEVDAGKFIRQIVKEIRCGGGIVPFIGSGFSAASGIIMGQDFDRYLAYTVFLCVVGGSRAEGDGSSRRWDLRKYGWPNYPTSEDVEKATNWIKEKFDELESNRDAENHSGSAKRSRVSTQPGSADKALTDPEGVARALTTVLTPRTLSGRPPQTELRRLLGFLGSELLLRGGYNVSGFSPTSEDAIIERAIRSLHDWRATLNFLSEIRLTEANHLLLDKPDPAIIDSFNVHITNGRKPNLAHNMLCHLAGPARFRVILTTNFDTLIEKAFEQLNEHADSISVSIKGTLPAPELVHARNTVVKLHGTRWETRADFSLDESPSPENLKRFFHYVRCRYPDEAATKENFSPSHLLVCGYSGSDRRCMEMIKFVLDAEQETKVYWICHSDKGMANLRTLFSESYNGRVIAVSTPRTDLLLYELYQHLCLSLPKGGFSYQYTANVPPSIPSNLEDKKHLKELGEEQRKSKQCWKLVKWFEEDAEKQPIVIDGDPGALATLRNSVEYIGEKKYGHVVWLELEDYPDVPCLGYELCLIISIRLGLFQLGHADMIPDSLIARIKGSVDKGKQAWCGHINALTKEYFNINPRQWLVVLYGRNGAGGCSSWHDGEFWGKEQYEFLSAFISALAECGYRVIYAPYSENRAARDGEKERKLKELMRDTLRAKADEILEIKYPIGFPEKHDLNFGIRIKPDEIVAENAIKFEFTMRQILENWIKNEYGKWDDKSRLERYRFLYASSLFRQSRHYSAFLNDGIIKCPKRFNWLGYDNDWARDQKMANYRDSLIACHFFYEKPGGFAWAYKDFRLAARCMVDGLPAKWTTVRSDAEPFEPFLTWRSNHHYWIADWYLRAFYTTGHATPLMEALYHLYQAIINLKTFRAEAKFQTSNNPHGPDDERAWRRYKHWRNAICDMIKALRVGRHTIRLWFGTPQYQAWFSNVNICNDCVLPETVINDLRSDAASGNKEELLLHAKQLHTLLCCEFARLSPAQGGDGRLKKFTSYVLKPASETIQTINPPKDDFALDDKECWRRSTGIVFEICEKVFALDLENIKDPASQETLIKDFSHQITILQRNSIRKNIADEYYFSLIQNVNEWAYLLTRRAKLRQRKNQLKNGGGLGLDNDCKKLWIAICVLCNSSLEFCRLLTPVLESFEVKERVSALCIYAVALARLNRFYEANRRLNEANALLSKFESQENPVLNGILQLRRAEVHLFESIFIKWFSNASASARAAENLDVSHLESRYFDPVPVGDEEIAAIPSKGMRIALAKLDDAWCALENAESLLSGQTHSPKWWARLCALKLQCLMEYHCPVTRSKEPPSGSPGLPPAPSWQNCTLARRIQSHPLHQIYDLMKNGLASSHGYLPLQLFILDYGIHAARAAEENSPKLHMLPGIYELKARIFALFVPEKPVTHADIPELTLSYKQLLDKQPAFHFDII